jgi:hypothetical protein
MSPKMLRPCTWLHAVRRCTLEAMRPSGHIPPSHARGRPERRLARRVCAGQSLHVEVALPTDMWGLRLADVARQGGGSSGQPVPDWIFCAANRTEAAARAGQFGPIPWHRTPACPVAPSGEGSPHRDIPLGGHLRVTPRAGGNPYRFPKSRAKRARLPVIGPTGWAADREDEKCSGSVSTGRGSGASALA